MHSEEQIQEKKDAIEIATESFVLNYMGGMFENNNELMYHMLENINILIEEYKRS